MKRVAIIDYGSGNLFSVVQALNKIGVEAILAKRRDQIDNSNALILPGVGAFHSALKRLNKNDLAAGIIDNAKGGKPLLGICLGMQLLFDSSKEFGYHNGLGLLRGEVTRFKNLEEGTRVPQTQWNRVLVNGLRTTLFQGIDNDPFMYFVHSYYVNNKHNEAVIVNAEYGGLHYCCAIEFEDIYGVQFHPERSASDGLRLLKNFCNLM